MQTPEKQTSISTVIAITALATALASGAYFHFQTTSTLKAKIAELESSAGGLPPETMMEMQQYVSSLKPVQAPYQGEAAPENWIYGSTAARYTLVEMTDTECPYCRDHFPLLKSMIDTAGGHINAALMHVPAISEASRQQAMAIECAGEQGGSETAWKYTQLVFDSTKSNGSGVTTSLSSLATQLDLDRDRFSACMESTAVLERVIGDMQQAIDLDIKQTPSTMVIDNVTGNSLVLQGANASHEGILEAITKVSAPGAKPQ